MHRAELTRSITLTGKGWGSEWRGAPTARGSGPGSGRVQPRGFHPCGGGRPYELRGTLRPVLSTVPPPTPGDVRIRTVAAACSVGSAAGSHQGPWRRLRSGSCGVSPACPPFRPCGIRARPLACLRERAFRGEKGGSRPTRGPISRQKVRVCSICGGPCFAGVAILPRPREQRSAAQPHFLERSGV